MSTTATLRPNADTSVGGGWSIVGGSGSHNAAESDNADGTYSSLSSGNTTGLTLDFGTVAIPALAQIRSVALRIRWQHADAAAGIYFWNNVYAQVLGTKRLEATIGNNGVADTSIRATTGTAQTTTPAGAAWTQADIDALQIVINDALGGGDGPGALRVMESYFDVVYNQVPVVAVTAPTGSPANTRPPVTWTYTDPDGDTQERYRAKIFSAAQYGAGGFDPETSTPVWDSGEVFSAGLTVTPNVDLSGGTTYKAYVKAADTGSSGRYSVWAAGSAFTITFDPVGQPCLSVPQANNTLARIQNLVIQGRTNLLTKASANFEDGTVGTWVAVTNCTISNVATTPLRGTKNLQMSSSAAGTVVVSSHLDTTAGNVLANALAITAKEIYTGMISVIPGTTARAGMLTLMWYDATGTLLGSSSRSFTQTAAQFQQVAHTVRAPVGAAFMTMRVTITGAVAAAELNRIDCAGIFQGVLNWLHDASFAEGTNLWGTVVAGGINQAVLVNAPGAVGSGAYYDLKRTDSANTVLVRMNNYYLAVNTGEVIELSAWIFPFTDVAFTGVQAMLSLVDQSGTSITTQNVSGLPAGQWSRVSWQVTIGATTGMFFRVFCTDGSANTGHIAVSALQAEIVSDAANLGFESAIGTAGNGGSLPSANWFGIDQAGNVTRDTVIFHTGTGSIKGGSSIAGTWASAEQFVHVAGFTSLDISYWWKLANVTGVGSHTKLVFYDAGMQIIGSRIPISNAGPNFIDDGSAYYVPASTTQVGTGSWNQQSFTGLPIPAGAAWMKIQLLAGFGGSTQTNWDDFVLTLYGTRTGSDWSLGGWSGGGLASTQYLVIERSADQGVTWRPVRIIGAGANGTDALFPNGYPITATPYRLGVTFDQEAPVGINLQYRCRALATDSGSAVSSPNFVRS